MKKYFLIPALFIAFVSCKNSGTAATTKTVNVYDTIPKYSKLTGDRIGDTILFVSGDSTVPFKKSDTLPGYYKATHDTSKARFVPAKQ